MEQGQLWDLKQVAHYLNISYSTLRRDWKKLLLPTGINPINVCVSERQAKATYRFVPAEIRAAIEKLRVIKKRGRHVEGEG